MRRLFKQLSRDQKDAILYESEWQFNFNRKSTNCAFEGVMEIDGEKYSARLFICKVEHGEDAEGEEISEKAHAALDELIKAGALDDRTVYLTKWGPLA